MRRMMGAAAGAAVLAWAGSAGAADVNLPKQLVTTAYNTGSSGYSQMVAVGKMLQNKYGVNLRVLPGKNDVARLTPVRAGKAQFTATGADGVYAQEAVFTFGTQKWGPMPVRLLAVNRSNGCTVFAVAKDTGVKTMADLKGKRVAWVRGSPALQKASEALLSYANLGWGDVEKVEVGGWAASINGIIDGDIDAAITASQSTFMLKMDASPRGVIHPAVPFDNEAGWKNIQSVVPWYYKHICTEGPGVVGGRQEQVASVYPILISTTETDDDTAYGMVKAMMENIDLYKDDAPGAYAWSADRQIDDYYLPSHPGAIRYWKEVGIWTDKAQANQEKQLQRQAILKEAWDAFVATNPSDHDKGWMAARAKALTDAGLEPVFTEW